MRELLTPKPLRELRIKADYLHHQTIDGAAGIKICANNLEGVVAGIGVHGALRGRASTTWRCSRRRSWPT